MDEVKGGELSPESKTPSTAVVPAGGGKRTPPPPPPPEEEDSEEGGMLRMSFLEHLEELRSRIIKMLYGLLVAFPLSFYFANKLWLIIQAPATDALRRIGAKNDHLVATEPL